MFAATFIKIDNGLKYEDFSYYSIAIENLCDIFHIDYSGLNKKIGHTEMIKISLENNEFKAIIIDEMAFVTMYANNDNKNVTYNVLSNDKQFQKIHDDIKKISHKYKLVYLANSVS